GGFRRDPARPSAGRQIGPGLSIETRCRTVKQVSGADLSFLFGGRSRAPGDGLRLRRRRCHAPSYSGSRDRLAGGERHTVPVGSSTPVELHWTRDGDFSLPLLKSAFRGNALPGSHPTDELAHPLSPGTREQAYRDRRPIVARAVHHHVALWHLVHAPS